MAEAAGSFVTRAFERMLKDSSAKKNANLQKALKAYLERSKKLELPSSPAASVENKEKIAEGVVAPSFEQGKETESGPASPTSSATGRPADAVSLSSTSLSAATTLATAGHKLESSEAELVLLPLRIAFETKQPKLVESALDCLHKLISYEHLEGDAGVEGGKNSSMITDMFNMVCAAADNNAPDSTILQVVKVLLIAAASTKFRVSQVEAEWGWGGLPLTALSSCPAYADEFVKGRVFFTAVCKVADAQFAIPPLIASKGSPGACDLSQNVKKAMHRALQMKALVPEDADWTKIENPYSDWNPKSAETLILLATLKVCSWAAAEYGRGRDPGVKIVGLVRTSTWELC
ncbi:hypothetical protein L7F22_066129 [Adiantum nelumboides]|nr:hypothetical protein [Adiantum nelumboides]